MADADTFSGEAIYRCELENGIDDLDDAVRAARSYRRFDQSDPIERELMLTLVNLARRCASAGNRQRLRFHVTSTAAERDAVFERLAWAADLKDWDGPAPSERPTGYVILLAPKPVAPLVLVDAGIAAQTMSLAAAQAGYGACMIRSFKPDLVDALGLDSSSFDAVLVLALGKPAEKVVLEPAGPTHGITYWRDDAGVHHVPKLALVDVLI